jgi:hypothetical protein
VDDPLTWFETVPPKVLDLWMALEELRNEEQDGHGEMMDPSQAHKALSGAFGK